MGSYLEYAKKKRKEEEESHSSSSGNGNYAKYAAGKRIGLDTFEKDLAEMGNTINKIHNEWQTPEAMSEAKTSVEDMQKRINDFGVYQKKYNPESEFDVDGLVEGYQSILDNWDNMSSLYSSFENADAYNKAIKKATLDKNFKGLSFDEVQSALKEFEPGSDEYNYLNTYTGYSSLSDFDKALKGSGGDYRDVLQRERNKYALDNAGDAYASLSENADYVKMSKYVPGSGNDSIYEFVNADEENRRRLQREHDMAQTYSGGYAQSPYSTYSLEEMKEKEIADYNYLYNTKGKDAAIEYLKNMQITLNKRATEKHEGLISDELDKEGTEGILNSVALSSASVPMNVLGGLTSGVDSAVRMATGQKMNPYSENSGLVNSAATIRENVMENVAEATPEWNLWGHNIPSEAIGLGLSIADSRLGASALGRGYSASMGATAGQQMLREMMEQGEDPSTAISMGLSAGGNEYIGELASLERLSKSYYGTGVKGKLVSLLLQGVFEGGEELLTEALNLTADMVIRNGNTEIDQLKDSLAMRGYSDEEIKKEVRNKVIDQLATSFVGGFASGAVMGGTEGFISDQYYKDIGASIKENDRVKDMLSAAESSMGMRREESEAYKLYTDYVKKGITADNINEKQLGRLYHAMEGETINALQEKKATPQKKWDARQNASKLNQVMTGKSKAEKVADSFAKGSETRLKESGQNINIKDVKMDGDKATLITSEGEFAASEVELTSGQADLIGYVHEMDDDKRRSFLENYDGKTDVESYIQSMELQHGYGKILYDAELALRNRGVLTEKQAVEAYRIGVKSRAKERQEKTDALNAKNVAKAFSKGSIDGSVFDLTGASTDGSKVRWDSLTEGQKNSVVITNMLFEDFGFDLTWRKSRVEDGRYKGFNGRYNEKTRKFELDVNAGFDFVGQEGESMIMTVSSHEITHSMKNGSPEIYNKLSEHVLKTLAEESGESIELIINKKVNTLIRMAKKRNEKDVSYIDREYAIDELVASACEDMLLHSQKMKDTLDRMKAEGKLSEDEKKTFVDKVKDTLKKLIKWAEEAIKTLRSGSAEAKLMRKDLDKFKAALGVWESGLEETVRTNQSMKAEKSTSEIAKSENLQEMTQIVELMGEDLGEVHRNSNGDATVVSNDDHTKNFYNERTYWYGGRDTLETVLKENGHTREEIENALETMDKTVAWLHELGGQNEKLADSLQTEVTVDMASGKVILHTIVSNGDYPINFDLSTICKKREAYQTVLNHFLEENIFDSILYDSEAVAKVNEILRKYGFETACAGCFVESRRVAIQNWADKFVEIWNAEVDKRTDRPGMFNLYESGMDNRSALTMEDIDHIERLRNDAAKNDYGNLNLGQGNIPTKIARYLDIVTKNNSNQMLNYLKSSDLVSPKGLLRLREMSPDMYSLLLGSYGSATPKPTQDFSPYDSDAANLSWRYVEQILRKNIAGKNEYITRAAKRLGLKKKDYNVSRMIKKSDVGGDDTKLDRNNPVVQNYFKVMRESIREYLYDIGGARHQSFSDFIIENVFDKIQLYADLYAQGFPLQEYTKEIADVRIFGMTGAKINGSVIHNIDKTLGEEYAGLQVTGKDKDGNNIYGYVPGDYQTFKKVEKEMKEKAAKEGRGLEAKDYETNFTQSIGYKDMVALMLDKRYSSNIGTIAIGFSDMHIEKMLNDPLIRMVIPYHKSGLPTAFAEITGMNRATNYEDFQNTTVIPTIYDENGNVIASFDARNHKVSTAFMFNAEMQKIAEAGRRPTATAREIADAKDAARVVARRYVEWCNEMHPVRVGKNIVGYVQFKPKFSGGTIAGRTYKDFTGHKNYYKMLEDFNCYDCITEEFAPQSAVSMRYPKANELSAKEYKEYADRLSETGLFTEEEVSKYVEKAKMSMEQIIEKELENRKDYRKTQSPKMAECLKEIDQAMADHTEKHGSDDEMTGAGKWNSDRLYGYDSIVNKGENGYMNVSQLDSALPMMPGKLFDRKKVVSEALNSLSKNDSGDHVVHNKDTGVEIVVRKNSLEHSLTDLDSAIVTKSIKELLENAIKVNEFTPRSSNVSTSVYIGFGVDEKRNEYAVRMIVNEKNGSADLDTYQLLYAVKGKKIEARSTTTIWDSNASHTASKVKIAQLLNYVKESPLFAYSVSEDVLNHFGMQREVNSFTKDLMYSDRIEDVDMVVDEFFDSLTDEEWDLLMDGYMALPSSWSSDVRSSNEEITANRSERKKYREKKSARGTVAKMTRERIDDLIEEYGASDPRYAKAYIGMIHPRDFLSLTLQDETLEKWDAAAEHGGDSEIYGLDKEKLANQKQTPFLVIDSADWVVTGHEGRHRMRALLDAGVTEIPIAIIDYATKYGKKAEDVLSVKSQDFGKGNVNDGFKAQIYNLVPANEAHRGALHVMHGAEGDIYYHERNAEDAWMELMSGEKAFDERIVFMEEDLGRLKKRLEAHGKSKLDRKNFESIARYFLESYGSTYSRDDLAEEIELLYDYIETAPVYDVGTMFAKFNELASKILKSAKNKKVRNDYAKMIMREIRSTRISLSDEQIAELKNEFGENYRRSLNGRVLVTNDGISLDSKWVEWSSRYPDIFDANISEANQGTALVRLYDAMKDASEITQSFTEMDDVQALALELYNKYWTTTSSEEIKKLNYEHRKAMEELRKSYEERIKKDNIVSRERIRSLMLEKEAEVRSAKQRGEEKMAAYKERLERETKIRMISRKAVTLGKWLAINDKNKHIIEPMKRPVAYLVDAIDFSSKQLLGISKQNKTGPTKNDISLAKAMDEVHKMAMEIVLSNAGVEINTEELKDTFVNLPEPTIAEIKKLCEDVNKIVEEVGDSRFVLNKMSLKQLNSLDTILTTLKTSVEKANECVAVAHKAGIDSLGAEEIKYLKGLGAKRLKGAGWSFFEYENALPYHVWKRLGEPGMKIFKAFMDGWDKFSFLTKKALDYAEESWDAKDMRKWARTVHEIDVPVSGEKNVTRKMKMTTTQIMGFYLLNQREAGRRHIYGGGIRPDDFTIDGKKHEDAIGTTVTKELAAEIVGRLTDEQKAVADKISWFLNNVCPEWGNEITMKLYGIKMFGKDDKYYPIVTDQNLRSVKPSEKDGSVLRLLNLGFTKSVNEYATDMVIIMDIADVFASHVSDMAKYNSLALAVYDAYRWLSYKDKMESNDDGSYKNGSVQQYIQHSMGKGMNKYIRTFLEDINGTNNGGRGAEITKKMMSNYKIAAVGGSIRVSVLQASSLFRAGAVLDYKNLVKGIVGNKQGAKKALEHSGIAVWKDMGYFDTNVSRNIASKLKNDASAKEKAVDFSMRMAGWFDKRTWGAIWNACELQTKDERKDLKANTNEFYEAVSILFRDVIYQTQVVDSTMTRSQLMRSKDSGVQTVTAFMSESTVAYNLLMEAAIDWSIDQRAGNIAGTRKNLKKFRKATMGYVTAAGASALMRTAVNFILDNDEEKEDGDEFLSELIENFISEVNPLAKIPIIKDVFTLIDGYDLTRIDEQSLATIWRAMEMWYKQLKDGDDVSYYQIYVTMQAISQFFGVPASNLFKDIVGIWNFVVGTSHPNLKLK